MKQRACIMYRRIVIGRFELANCRARAHEKRWDVVAEIGIAFDGQKAAEGKLLRLARHREFDVLMIPELECLGTIKDMLKISGVLNDNGIELYKVR